MPTKQYWYITYQTGRGLVEHDVIDEHPVEFAKRCSVEYDDSPYTILFTIEITESQFNDFKD